MEKIDYEVERDLKHKRKMENDINNIELEDLEELTLENLKTFNMKDNATDSNSGSSCNSIVSINSNSNDNDNQNDLYESPFKISLFPNDIFGSPVYLSLYFPNEKAFILKSMWKMLVISAIFVLIIILYSTIRITH